MQMQSSPSVFNAMVNDEPYSDIVVRYNVLYLLCDVQMTDTEVMHLSSVLARRVKGFASQCRVDRASCWASRV